jgi:hypothetical protein
MVFQYPGGATLIRHYLALIRLGGGAAAILTVDSDVAKAWPETFGNSGAPGEPNKNSAARSGRVKIMLLGRDKVFLGPDIPDKTAAVGPLMIDRSRVHEIMFLPRQQHDAKVPAT